MAILHAKPSEVIDVSPLAMNFSSAKTTTLVKTNSIEVIRLVLPAGKVIAPHSVPGEVTVQCLEGHVVFTTKGTECDLTAGKLIYLEGSDEHAVCALEDSSLLVTIQLTAIQ